MRTMGFIGTGNMGGAIIRSLAGTQAWNILVYDVRADAALSLARECGCERVSMEELLERSDIIVLAVKPQVLPSLYERLSKYPSKDWISMAAGVALETLTEKLHSNQVVRIMPNIAASEKKAVTAIAPHPEASEKLVEEVVAFVEKFGTAHVIDQRLFGAFIGISGSAIATVFSFLHGMAMGGVREGLPYAKALQLISDTAEGAIALTRATGKHPEELMTQVCSPGGTTVEAMKVLAGRGFTDVLMESVSVASERALELEAKAKEGS